MLKKGDLRTPHASLTSSKAFKALCKEGCLEEAFEAIHLRRVRLSKDVLFSLLLAAIEREDIHAGRNIDLLMSSAGFYRVSILADHLIRLFALCGSLSEANAVFRKVASPSVYTWNSIISAHGKLGLHEQVLALFQEMQELGAEPDGVTFSCLLKACGSLQDLRTGCQREAEDLVKTMPNIPDIVVWTSMLTSCKTFGSSSLA